MKIVVYTLGCKVNQYESDGLVFSLKKLGHEVFTNIVSADVYILNSCAVTNEAEKKSRQIIAKFKACNPNAKIFVCGCASQKNAEQFKDISGVKFVKGTANKLSLIESFNKSGIEIDKLPLNYNEDFTTEPSKTRAYVKIQDGCNNFCSYCIIPYLRGRSRSRDLISIIKEIDELSHHVKEIVLTGIDISDYKIDGEKSFYKLIEQLEPYSNIRFRLGSLEQGLVDENFLQAMKKVNICPHFHLSLQSGSDSVLKRMNRKYTTKQFLESVNLINKYYKNACITTDVIVGFPQESDKEFKQTLKFVQKVGFYNIHIFPYSMRSGTVAAKMLQIDGNIKRNRAKKLAKVNEKLNKKYIKKITNEQHCVLVEEFDGEFYIGHAENYVKCYITEKCEINEFVNVKIKSIFKDGALAVKI